MALTTKQLETTLPAAECQIGTGLHLDLPAKDYFALPYASASLLGAIKRSPAHARQMSAESSIQTSAMKFGTACHYAILQPELFRKLYTVADQCAAILSSGRNRGSRCSNSGIVARGTEWYCGMHDPENGEVPDDVRDVLRADDFDKCLRMADAVLAHPAARALLEAKTHAEASAIWTDRETSVRCKLRADMLCAGGIVSDLKTTADAGRDSFERSIFKYGYYRQAAMYLNGLGEMSFVPGYEHFCIVAVESAAPFAVAVYRLQDDVIDAGREEVSRLLKVWAECERTGEWPGYDWRFQDVSLPDYAWKQLEQVG